LGLPAIDPLGSLPGEGEWAVYLYDQHGDTVAFRTYLQPDPRRSYTVVAVVATDLTRSRLHFVLGTHEPALPGGPRGDGWIREADRRGGRLLAAFNGAFRAANGGFGAMADGRVALPPMEGMATVAIYRGGEVRIGSWGEQIVDAPDLVAWRQNCRLIIDGGQISPLVYNDSIVDWGGTIENEIVTWRSALGLGNGRNVLYYFAGPALSMTALAEAMHAAGVEHGMLLDINSYWVVFTAIHESGDGLIAEPLIPDRMTADVDRYLRQSPRDFFYLTSAGP
jgi:hypothetical protein